MNYLTEIPIISYDSFADYKTYYLYCILDRSILKTEEENLQSFLQDYHSYAPQDIKEFLTKSDRYLSGIQSFLKPIITEQTAFERAFAATGKCPPLPIETAWACNIQIFRITQEYKDLQAGVRLALILVAADDAGYLPRRLQIELVDIDDGEEL
jgi:hypothetical protein